MPTSSGRRKRSVELIYKDEDESGKKRNRPQLDLKKIEDAGATFRSLGETFETESPAGRMMMKMVGLFAEFEREVIVDRIKRGLAHARANGKIGGGRYKLSPEDQREAIRLIQVEQKSQGQVAHIYKVDRSTISRMMTEVRLKQDLKGGVL
jgi:DNA invertase Pin-like site-specific DNA recombinase